MRFSDTPMPSPASGPHYDRLKSIAQAGLEVGWGESAFRDHPAVQEALSLAKAEQKSLLFAVFHEIGEEVERVAGPRDQCQYWWGMNHDHDHFNVYCALAKHLLRRDHDLSQEEWAIILGDVGRFPFVYLGLSHHYAEAMISRIERDSTNWNDVSPALHQRIARVAEALGLCSGNAPQQKASERLLTILRRFEAKKNVASRSAASALTAAQQEVRMVPSPPIESTVPPVAAFLLDNYITTLAQKPLMVLKPADEPRPTTLDDILATDSDTLREVLREALVMLAWLRDPKHPPPPPRWDTWHFECVPHRIIESLCLAILHRDPDLDDELLLMIGDATLHPFGRELSTEGILQSAILLERRLSHSEATMDLRRLATEIGDALARRSEPTVQHLAELLSMHGAGRSVNKSSPERLGASSLPEPSPAIRGEIASLLSQLGREVVDMEVYHGHVFGGCPSFALLCALPRDRYPELLRQASRRHDELAGPDGTKNSGGWTTNPGCRERLALVQVIGAHLPKAVEGSPDVIDALCAWVASQQVWAASLDRVEDGLLKAVEKHAKAGDVTPTMAAWLTIARERWSNYPKTYASKIRRSGPLLSEELIIDLDPGEPWAAQALADVNASSPATRTAWTHLIDHCMGTSTSAPSAKWSARASELVKAIGKREFEAAVLRWLPLVNAPRTTSIGVGYVEMPVGSLMLLDRSMCTLRGVVWALSLAPTPTNTPDIARALGHLVISAYRKVPERGPRAVLVGNAAIHALGQMKGQDALGQLAMLRVKVKFGTGQKMLEKALVAAATREGLPRDEIEELAVPSYGMTEVGVRRDEIGEFIAELRIESGGTPALTFTKQSADAKGKPPKAQKSVPASIKADHADDLKDLKAASKDIAAMLPAQRDRIDSLFVENRTWPLDTWRERYLDHPLVGTIARRLIWTFTPQEIAKHHTPAHATWLDERASLVDVSGEPFTPEPGATVSLWHPITHTTDEIVAWRRFFEDRQIRQPFKQAHREVYILTDAERNTGTYSNRYAAHIIRQHQFNALCAARHWKNKLRLLVDAEYPPATRHLAAFGLRAEFWIEGVGDDFGVHTNEAGTFHFLATDQVRFYQENAAQGTAHASGGAPFVRDRAAPGNPINEPIPLDQIPALAFSEIMRDVDLFVGVASMGNNPNWADGGPTNEHRDYWWEFSFGAVSESGKTRRDILSRLVPRLKIAPVCTLADQFLIVKGKIRTYKIHLGSGNILMEPNDQYLCIVPSSRDETLGGASGGPGVFLPFEGDRTLSIILSKAFMLAADDTIIDPSIRSQITRK